MNITKTAVHLNPKGGKRNIKIKSKNIVGESERLSYEFLQDFTRKYRWKESRIAKFLQRVV